MRKGTIAALVLIFGLLVLGGSCAKQYNGLVTLSQQVDSQWAQVENAYQRRMDLVPNLVETVKGAAKFEQQTFTQVAQARSQAAQAQQQAQAAGTKLANDPKALQQYQAAQDQLSGALGRLMVVVEKYPELKATQNFRDLQAQLEGTENRIAVERMRFNEAARKFNTKRDSFPTTIVAGAFGSKFKPKAYFTAQAGAQQAPRVQFQ